MKPVQQDLFAPTLAQQFEAWVHTPEGGKVADWFIRLAIGCRRRGQKVGARAIWERLRWHFDVVKSTAGKNYRFNDHYPPYLARLAMDRVPELRGMFELREVGKVRPKSKRIITIVEEKAA